MLADPKAALPQPREQAVELLTFRATALARQGKYDDALATAEELRQLAPSDPEHLYQVARCYALLVRAVARGRLNEKLSPDEQARRAACAGRAVEALAEAVKRGYHDAVHLLEDSDLDIIRPEPGYRDIIARLKPDPDQVVAK